ncbi:FecR family protein [Snuella sedimenti]|uniref:FecR domain-containing protein n=1 Tax=Snuella sedimenti TaxID=2798802 RepID=A0A8J7LTK2_9FLAO|nr:FecR domain-containing protein [Snuella sedimenti]MBJ6368466.1 FecR domain-containing protein [Snuella sedimenti]
MKAFNNDDSFLARWISGELSAEELDAFKRSKEYSLFNKINETSTRLKAPEFDAQTSFIKLSKRNLTKTKEFVGYKRNIIPNWAYAAAAMIVLAFGVFYFLNTGTQFRTGFSEQLAVVLPDDSKVQLNANSQLDFKKINWSDNRLLHLKGEAFFDVEKGASFKVLTEEGIVEVLGTEFNVIARNGYFEVQCKEGKVKVTCTLIQKEAVLLPGNALRLVDNVLETWNFNITEPSWLIGESTFKNTPISQVLIALENQYNITCDVANIDLNKRFTGGFPHNDLKLALKMVTTPMEYSYTFNEAKGVIVLNSNNKN